MQISLNVMSQDRNIFEGQAIKISLPTEVGTLTILPDHTELITLLTIGNLVVETPAGANTLSLLVSGGISYFHNNKMLVLAEEAIVPADLTAQEIEKAVKNAMEEISQELPPAMFIQLEKQLKFALFKKNFFENIN